MQKIILLGSLLLVFNLISACVSLPEIGPQPTETDPAPTASATSTDTPTATSLPSDTPEPTQTPTPTTVPTATWPVVGPGEVVAPILMYHHIDPDESTSPRYNTSPDNFAAQMQALDDWGYNTITAKQLVMAITKGAPLPPRPVVITFDDGHYSVYQCAFPVMQAHGFVGVSYIVANRLKSYGFTGAPQLKEMIEAGWEIGSHSFTHSDLTLDHSILFNEIYYSRMALNEALTQDVVTFAYPFGAFDQFVGSRTSKWGYIAGMGLGSGYTHSPDNLYYLQRIEVQGTYDLEKFASLLPWSAPPE